MSYSIELPKVKERIKLGNDIIGFVVIDVETQMQGYKSKQREIRLGINPIQFEITHHFKQCLKFGLSLNRFALRTEFQYGSYEKI